MTLFIWFLAPVLAGVIGGMVGGFAIGALIEAVREYYVKVGLLNKETARNISEDHFSNIIKNNFKINNFNTCDIGLTSVIADCGDEKNWDVVKAYYDEENNEYLCVTEVKFDSIDEELKNELLTEEIVIL